MTALLRAMRAELWEGVRSGEVGTLYIVRLAGHDPAPPPDEYIPQSGGIFRDFSVHDFDVLRWMTGCEVEEVEKTDDKLVTIITTCPFFDNMVDMYGKEAASEMMKKTIGPTSANYYQARMKAIGLWETFFVTQDQFRSLGDSVCRMVYIRRSAQTPEPVND